MTELTPEHKLLCDVAAVKVHLDKYSRIEQRALLKRVMDHLNAVVEAQRTAPQALAATPAVGGEADTRFVNCQVCQTEGRILTNDGGPDDVDHGICPECNGERVVEVEVKPVSLEDLKRKNCRDADDCQYPDCGCAINFNALANDEDETDPNDTGALIIAHEKSGGVTVMVRAPRSTMESKITLPLDNWLTLIATPPASPLRGRDELIEKCAKIAEPWSGFIDADKMGAADNGVIKVRNDIAAAIRSLSASPPEQPEFQRTNPLDCRLSVATPERPAQPQSLPGCLHPGTEPKSCQYEGQCLSAACNHNGKTTFRPRMTLEAQVDGILYPKVET